MFSHSVITASTMLCERCYNNTPKGLNAPDPVMPRSKLAEGAEELPPPPSTEDDDAIASVSLASFSEGKLGLKGAPREFQQPAEIIADLRERRIVPRGSFQPPAYATIRRSVYKHDGYRERLPDDEVMVCSCAPSRGGCDERCQNRAMQHECSLSTCPCSTLCTNRPFSTLLPTNQLPLQLFKTERKGWGVMATKDIAEGELVVEYVGEVIDTDSWEARKKALGRFEHMYFMALNADEVVDASRKGNIARFINHSCRPNLAVEKWYVNRVPRLGLWAKRPITAGEELSYDYKVKWSGDPDHAQTCYCEAPNCTGFLGRRPK